jgi:hypothetical protein
MLVWKLRGHDAYYGVRANYRMLSALRYHVERIWSKWLGRRSRKALLNWGRMNRLLRQFPLPRPRIIHPRRARVANP